MTTKQQIEKIVTYHSDDGTSGYLLSNDQIAQLLRIVTEARVEELESLWNKLPYQDDSSKEVITGQLISNRIKELKAKELSND